MNSCVSCLVASRPSVGADSWSCVPCQEDDILSWVENMPSCALHLEANSLWMEAYTRRSSSSSCFCCQVVDIPLLVV